MCSRRLSTLVLFATSCLAAHAAASCANPNALRMLEPKNDLQIEHYEVMGMLANSTQRIPTLAHIYLRAVRKESRVLIRGFLFFERADEAETLHPLWGGHIIQPEIVLTLTPINVTLRLREGGEIALDVKGHGDTFRPFHISGSASLDDWDKVDTLHVLDWTRHVLLRPLAAAQLRAAADAANPPPQALVGMVPLEYIYNKERATYLTAAHVAWHVAMGFNGSVLYTSSSEMYAEAPSTRAQLCGGQLHLMRWQYADSGYAFQQVNMYRKYDQNLVYNHMLLAYWQYNTHLLLTDVDEYLAFPKPGTLQQLLSPGGCLAPFASQAILKRHDSAVLREASGGAAQPELLLWDEWYAANSTAEVGVMRLYRHVSRGEHLMKVLISTDAASQFGIHVGVLLEPQQQLDGAQGGHDATDHPPQGQGDVPRECAYILHLRNLVDSEKHVKIAPPRQDDPDWFMFKKDVGDLAVDDSWQWPLQLLAQQQHGSKMRGGAVVVAQQRQLSPFSVGISAQATRTLSHRPIS